MKIEKIPAGWHKLKIGTVIKPGDKCRAVNGGWVVIMCDGCKVGRKGLDALYIRRK